jgi:hypothetical protein
VSLTLGLRRDVSYQYQQQFGGHILGDLVGWLLDDAIRASVGSFGWYELRLPLEILTLVT